jgi:hypothetical protein
VQPENFRKVFLFLKLETLAEYSWILHGMLSRLPELKTLQNSARFHTLEVIKVLELNLTLFYQGFEILTESSWNRTGSCSGF